MKNRQTNPILWTKHYANVSFDFSNCPESGNLHLWLPDRVFAKMDKAMKARSIQTREDFCVLAILWALGTLDE